MASPMNKLTSDVKLAHGTGQSQTSEFDQTTPEPQGVFIYGTLMAEELLSWVLTGSSQNHGAILTLRQPAILKGYRRVPVRHSDYPALIPGTPSDQVEGYLIVPASASQRKKIDDFEGEVYRRENVSVLMKESGQMAPAQVYVWAEDMGKLERDEEWDYAYFRNERLQDWLDLFDGMEMVG